MEPSQPMDFCLKLEDPRCRGWAEELRKKEKKKADKTINLQTTQLLNQEKNLEQEGGCLAL